MLTELRIKNFAIIEALSLPLARGFNVLSGETGAGKSIIVGALGLLLGERASVDLIRTGCDRASVEGVFDAAPEGTLARLLDARGIELDEEEHTVVLKREIAAGGRTRAWVNGTAVTAGVLAEVGRLLVSLHGQHEAQTLLDTDSQRHILDAFGGANAHAERVREAAGRAGRGARGDARARRPARRGGAPRRLPAPRRQGDRGRAPRRGRGRAARGGGAAPGARRGAAHARRGRGGAARRRRGRRAPRLAAVHRSLGTLERIDPSLARLSELYDSGFYALEELSRELVEYERGVELDPERLQEVQRRRDLIFRLCKKYGPALADVIEQGRRAREELDLVDSAGIDLRSLERARRGSATASRPRPASSRACAPSPPTASRSRWSRSSPTSAWPTGASARRCCRARAGRHRREDVEFRVALNLGHDARPLARAASGGELSRVMLALKTILARLDRVPTLVFDEVDAGIGGRVGLMVGETMRRVAAHHQVFAISHLPQLARGRTHHILVSRGARAGVHDRGRASARGVTIGCASSRACSVGTPKARWSRAHAGSCWRLRRGPGCARPPRPQTAWRGRTRRLHRPLGAHGGLGRANGGAGPFGGCDRFRVRRSLRGVPRCGRPGRGRAWRTPSGRS
jgi:DNA repair protein RecN (Recombination protein N)